MPVLTLFDYELFDFGEAGLLSTVKALDKLFLPVNFRSVTEIFKLSKSLNSSLTDMLEPHFHEKVVEQELQQRLEEQDK